MATQEEYRAKAREALEKLQQQIDELRVQANLAGAEARDRFEQAIDALRKRQSEIRTRLDQAGDASGDAWKSGKVPGEDAELEHRLVLGGIRSLDDLLAG